MSRWMLTIPRETCSRRKLFQFIKSYDIHKWVIGREIGDSGYRHWQIRFESSQFETSSEESFKIIKQWFKEAHVEQNASDNWEYEKEEGNFLAWDDTPVQRRQRAGKLRATQQFIINLARDCNLRQIVVWYDSTGNVGKSWFTSALVERRKAHNILVSNTAKGLIQDCASEVIDNGKREFIIIDIPRTWKWTEELYYAIEKVQDGLIKDTRYHSRTVNIAGAHIIIMCNSPPKVSKLSEDRWVIYYNEPSYL